MMFTEEQGIKFRTVITYTPMDNRQAESMVGMLEKSIGWMGDNGEVNWEIQGKKSLYGYMGIIGGIFVSVKSSIHVKTSDICHVLLIMCKFFEVRKSLFGNIFHKVLTVESSP